MGAAYQSQAISGYNASPPPDDGTTVAANKITWNSTIKTKLSDPLNTFIAAVNSQLVTWSDFSSVTTSTNLTTTTAHHMQTIEVTSGSPTISLGDAATMTKNYVVTVTNTGTGAPVIALATAGNTLDGTAAGTFTFPTGTATSFTFKVNNGATGYYTEKIGGKSPLVYGSLRSTTSVITPIVDSGSTGSISFNTNNGTEQFGITHTASANTRWDAAGGVSGATPALLTIAGSGTNNNGRISSMGTGSVVLYSAAGSKVQLEVLGTGPGTNWITVTSSATNPTIGTTGGNLAITPSVVIAGATVQVGGTAAATGAYNSVFGNGLYSRNAAGGADIVQVQTGTINSKTDWVCVGNTGGGSFAASGVILQGRVVAGAPTTTDIPSGLWALWRDSSGATTKLYYNNGGSLQSVALS